MPPTGASIATRTGTNSLSEPANAVVGGVLQTDHYIAKLGLDLRYDGVACHGTAPVRPEAFAPGTRRLRTGYLATLVDVVAGHAPNGAVGPTVDLRIQVVGQTPTDGDICLTSRPLRIGSRLIVGETLLCAGDDPVPFARAVTTFMHVRLDVDLPARQGPLPAMDEPSLDAFLGVARRDERSLVLEPVMRLANGMAGTVQGGVQALFAEIAADQVLGGAHGPRLVASDLDIRYLDRVRVGPLVATVDPLGGDAGARLAVVTLSDGGTERIVARVGMTLDPAH